MAQQTQLQLLTAEVTAAADDLGRVRLPPEPPFVYGSDLDCVVDVTPTWDELPGDTPKAIAQALLRRWSTEQGSLAVIEDDGDYGLGLLGWINRGTARIDLLSLAGRMSIEARQDDRVAGCVVTLEADLRVKLLHVRAQITPIDPSIGEFLLTFALTEDGTPVLSEPGTLPFPPVVLGALDDLVVDAFGDEVVDDASSLIVVS